MTAAEQAADVVFMQLLVRLTMEGRTVSEKSGANYAPHVFSQEREAKFAKLGKRPLAEAMRRLFRAKQIASSLATGKGAKSIAWSSPESPLGQQDRGCSVLDRSCQVQRAPLSVRGDDLYETPAVAVDALLRVEQLPHWLWEPAAGRGAIVNVLRAAGIPGAGKRPRRLRRADAFRAARLPHGTPARKGRGNRHQSALQAC